MNRFANQWSIGIFSVRGFSLAELAVVLFIMGLLLQASIEPLSTGLEHKRRAHAGAQLTQVREHLRAYWVSYGHLPCPISAGAVGVTGGLASAQSAGCELGVGGVPAAALGIVGARNSAGELLDPWGGVLKYAVSLTDVNATDVANTPDWLTQGELSQVTFTELQADLVVCHEAAPGGCTTSNNTIADLVAIVVSSGSKESPREQDNNDADLQYISAPYSLAQPHEFDDQLIWVGRSEFIYLALQAGWIP